MGREALQKLNSPYENQAQVPSKASMVPALQKHLLPYPPHCLFTYMFAFFAPTGPVLQMSGHPRGRTQCTFSLCVLSYKICTYITGELMA